MEKLDELLRFSERVAAAAQLSGIDLVKALIALRNDDVLIEVQARAMADLFYLDGLSGKSPGCSARRTSTG